MYTVRRVGALNALWVQLSCGCGNRQSVGDAVSSGAEQSPMEVLFTDLWSFVAGRASSHRLGSGERPRRAQRPRAASARTAPPCGRETLQPVRSEHVSPSEKNAIQRRLQNNNWKWEVLVSKVQETCSARDAARLGRVRTGQDHSCRVALSVPDHDGLQPVSRWVRRVCASLCVSEHQGP